MTDSQKPSAPAPTAKKGGRSKLIVIAAIGVVLLGGGGLAAYWTLRKPAGGAEVTEHVKKPDHNGIVSFEPFVVNLADAGGQRFLRVSVRLIVDEQEEAERIQKSEVLLMRLRSSILELLTQQTADQVVTQDGKSSLKKTIATRAAAIAEPAKVSDVLFSDFVVQF